MPNATRSQAAVRAAWDPACVHLHRPHLRDWYQAIDEIMESFGYAPKAGQTYAANCRNVTGGTTPSLHSYFGDETFTTWTGVVIQIGVACDYNSASNPYGATLKTDMPRDMVTAILAVRTMSGVQVGNWGGYFTGHKDAMHYEVNCTPADLASGIDWSTVQGHTTPTTPTQGDDLFMGLSDERQKDLATKIDQIYETTTKSGYIEKLVNMDQDEEGKLAEILADLKASPDHGAGAGDIDPATIVGALRDALVKGTK